MKHVRTCLVLGLVVAGTAALSGCAGTPALPGAGLRTGGASPRTVNPSMATFVEYTSGITAGALPRGITHSPTAIWFTEPGVDKIGQITPTGAVTEYPVTPGSAPNNIVYGPDGNLWYTEAGDVIGRMSPRGHVKEFTIGAAASGPWDIAAGSDGNLWFTYRAPNGGSYDNAIGRITTAGVVTLYTAGLSPGDVAVHGISPGPDGNLWFTEEFGNRVGFVTTSGAITEYSAGISPVAAPVDITGGPDGNLWFSEVGTGDVARITLGGTVTEFPISSSAQPGAIATLGNYVWVCETGTDQLGRVSMTGAVKNFALPGQRCSQDEPLKTHLWITDSTGNGLIRGSGL